MYSTMLGRMDKSCETPLLLTDPVIGTPDAVQLVCELFICDMHMLSRSTSKHFEERFQDPSHCALIIICLQVEGGLAL
jgi:hypothetical protein